MDSIPHPGGPATQRLRGSLEPLTKVRPMPFPSLASVTGRLTLTDASRDRLAATADLYRALGGGWAGDAQLQDVLEDVESGSG